MLYYAPVVGSAYTLAVLLARQHGCVGSNTRDHGHTRSFRRDLGRLAPPPFRKPLVVDNILLNPV